MFANIHNTACCLWRGHSWKWGVKSHSRVPVLARFYLSTLFACVSTPRSPDPLHILWVDARWCPVSHTDYSWSYQSFCAGARSSRLGHALPDTLTSLPQTSMFCEGVSTLLTILLLVGAAWLTRPGVLSPPSILCAGCCILFVWMPWGFPPAFEALCTPVQVHKCVRYSSVCGMTC